MEVLFLTGKLAHDWLRQYNLAGLTFKAVIRGITSVTNITYVTNITIVTSVTGVTNPINRASEIQLILLVQ